MSDVQNQAAETTQEAPVVDPNATVVLSDVKFNFKQRKILDDSGAEIGKSKKQPALIAQIPVPTIKGLIEILEDDSNDPLKAKIKLLILESVQELVKSQARAQLDEIIEGFGNDDSKVVTAGDLDLDKLSLEYIAQIPPAQRGAKAIPEEDWNAFFQDYIQVMVATTGKPEDKIKKHLEIFKKPTRVKQNKEVLTVLEDQLNIYMASSKAVEDTGECASRLLTKFSKWKSVDDTYDPNAL